MYIIIAGGGKVGFHLAQELLEANHEVLVLELPHGRCKVLVSVPPHLVPELGETLVHGPLAALAAGFESGEQGNAAARDRVDGQPVVHHVR